MSVNLTLIPVWGGLQEFNDHDIIVPASKVEISETVDIDSLQTQIKKLKPPSLPKGKKIILRERSDKPTNKNPYGEKITYLLPKDFRKIKLVGANEWDVAALNFCGNLPGNTIILLFWH